MKLYTKRGDDGTTGLIGGKSVAKSHPRVAAYGEVDEANAVIGAAVSACEDAETTAWLRQIQDDLFVIGAELATPPPEKSKVCATEEQISRLEGWIDRASEETPELKSFILPGGTPSAAWLHVARTVVRRAERCVVELSLVEEVSSAVVVYLNRLSDLLFALARRENFRARRSDVEWHAKR